MTGNRPDTVEIDKANYIFNKLCNIDVQFLTTERLFYSGERSSCTDPLSSKQLFQREKFEGTYPLVVST